MCVTEFIIYFDTTKLLHLILLKKIKKIDALNSQ